MRHYPARIVVVRRDEPGDSMFFISEGQVEVRLPRGSVALDQGGFFGEMALLDRLPRSATVVTSQPTTLLVLYASDFYEIAANIPSLVEAVEHEARRRRAENQGNYGAEPRRHESPLAGPRPSAISQAAERPLNHVAHYARHPGRRLRQAPVAAVARKHAQAVRAAARQAVDLPADPVARDRPQPVCTARDRHQRCLPLHGREPGARHRHGDRHPGRAVAPRFRPGDGRRRGLLPRASAPRRCWPWPRTIW